MKATLEFNLPEDTIEHEMYVRAPAMHSALREIRENLRALRKLGFPKGMCEEVGLGYAEALEDMWTFFHDACEGFVDTL